VKWARVLTSQVGNRESFTYGIAERNLGAFYLSKGGNANGQQQ
jgi:hypothetical protein